MAEKTVAGNTATFSLNPLCADDVWDLVEIIGKVGLTNIYSNLPEDLIAKSQFKAPTKYDRKTGSIVPLPRDKWNDQQIQAETDAQIAQERLSMAIVGVVINNIGNCKANVNNLLARSIDKKPEEVAKMPALDYVNLISAFVSREEFTDFFTQALKLAQTQMKSSTSLFDAMGKA